MLCVAALAACDYPEVKEVNSPLIDRRDPQTERVAEFVRCTKVRLQPVMRFAQLKV